MNRPPRPNPSDRPDSSSACPHWRKPVRSWPRSSSGPVCSGTPELPFLPPALQTLTVVVTARSVRFWAVRLMRGAVATWILAPRREALIRRLNWSLCRRGATANPALQHVSTCCRFALAGLVAPHHPRSSSSDDQAGQPASDRCDRCCISRGGAGPRRLRCGDPAGRRGAVGRRDHLPRDQRHLQPLPGAVGGREPRSTATTATADTRAACSTSRTRARTVGGATSSRRWASTPGSTGPPAGQAIHAAGCAAPAGTPSRVPYDNDRSTADDPTLHPTRPNPTPAPTTARSTPTTPPAPHPPNPTPATYDSTARPPTTPPAPHPPNPTPAPTTARSTADDPTLHPTRRPGPCSSPSSTGSSTTRRVACASPGARGGRGRAGRRGRRS